MLDYVLNIKCSANDEKEPETYQPEDVTDRCPAPDYEVVETPSKNEY